MIFMANVFSFGFLSLHRRRPQISGQPVSSVRPIVFSAAARSRAARSSMRWRSRAPRPCRACAAPPPARRGRRPLRRGCRRRRSTHAAKISAPAWMTLARLAEHLVVAGASESTVWKATSASVKRSRSSPASRICARPLSRSAISWTRRALGGIVRRPAGSMARRASRMQSSSVEFSDMRAHPLQHLLVEDVPVVLVADDGADARLAAHQPLSIPGSSAIRG